MAREDARTTTLADYVALAICPALIIGLVTSLVFFLSEVLYSGPFLERLRWMQFFFVVGAVCIARIAMTGGISDRAGMYGLVLGVVVFIGMQMYVEYPKDSVAGQLSWLINLGLIGLVWWSAHRLTNDCTQVDDDADVTGEGVLQAAGLDQPSAAKQEEQPSPADQGSGWWQRFMRYREQRRKRRTLGVWIIWFSLAAFPIFGLGQSLIPAEAAGRRQYSFWLMTVYLGCGLGLLLTTCFLGLRRYLRQRRAQMPAAVTGAWLLSGGGLAIVLLALGAFLPRPEMEYPLIDFSKASSPDREASRLAMKGDSATKGDGSGGDQPKEGEKDGDNQAKGDGDGKGKDPGGKGEPNNQGKDSGGKDGSGKDGDSSKGDSGQDKGKDGSNSDQKGDKNDSGKRSSDQKQSDNPKQNGGKKQDGGQQGKSSSSSSSRAGSGSWSEALKPLAGVLKWIVFAIVAVVVVVFLLRGLLRFFANFTGWARGLLDFFNRLWASLFGARPQPKQSDEEAQPKAEPKYEAPFSAFPNPFGAAVGGGMSRKELVRYTFAAVQAWGRERGVGRQPCETPLEFIQRLSDEVPALEDALRRLVMLYGRAVYASSGLPENSTEAIREIWDRLEAVVEQPLSA